MPKRRNILWLLFLMFKRFLQKRQRCTGTYVHGRYWACAWVYTQANCLAWNCLNVISGFTRLSRQMAVL